MEIEENIENFDQTSIDEEPIFVGKKRRPD